MGATEQNQVQKRGMLHEMCYSTIKSFFDSIGVEINGDGKGELIKLIEGNAFDKNKTFLIQSNCRRLSGDQRRGLLSSV